MTMRLVGSRSCCACKRPGPVSNTFTNGIGWRELCDDCAEMPVLLPQIASATTPPSLAVLAQ